MGFELRLSDMKIGGKKSNKHKSEMENITNLYDLREEVIKFHKDYYAKFVMQLMEKDSKY